MTDKTIAQYLHLAQSQQQQGKLNEAITTYRQAILEFPQNYQPYNHLGKALLKQGNLAEAIAIFGQGIKVKPHVWVFPQFVTRSKLRSSEIWYLIFQ